MIIHTLVSTLTGCAKCRPYCCLGALTDICTATDQKMFDTVCLSFFFRVHKIGILQIRKKGQNHEILRILALFLIFEIPLLSILTGHMKCHNVFPHRCCVESVWEIKPRRLGVGLGRQYSLAQTWLEIKGTKKLEMLSLLDWKVD